MRQRHKALLSHVLRSPVSEHSRARSLDTVDQRQNIREFLTSRRARLKPEDVGLPALGSRRRVKGLRREEVAMLAGVSVDYYARLERGYLSGASEAVIDSLGRALRLNDAEFQHLLDLAAASPRTRTRHRTPSAKTNLRPAMTSILTGLVGIPAYIRTHTMDILAVNTLCQALYDGALEDSRLPLNLARFVFLDPRARNIYVEWHSVADDLTGALRIQAGRDPRNHALRDLVGELSTRSDEFVARWSQQNVRLHQTARKTLHNRTVGEIQLTGNALQLPADDLVLVAYTAEPNSAAEEQLALLTSWAGSLQTIPRDVGIDSE